ncbi:aspartic proteinase CDR1-like [Lolium rigidum]|uniref:aspartic proteinase CDR1-like n=1 Tax=Lolium rigidum TaxID=89674 RepID=UPI001F5DA46E|nr:aspartic proteinase CDR1-like [Lolium rigidum]
MAGTTVSRALLLLLGVVLTAQLCGCTAYVGRGEGFSVEFIHRDDVRSPYHDPSLTAHERVLGAIRRSTARAAVLAPSHVRGDDDAPAPSTDGAVSEVTSKPFEYLMAVTVGTPSTRMLAIADTGSDLIWLNCTDDTGKDAPPPTGVFYPDNSTTFGLVDCDSGACRALNDASCTQSNHCKYLYSYGDGSRTSGLLSTETFTFDDGVARHSDEAASLRVANVNFGCSTENAGTFPADGLVGLGGGELSLVTQLGNDTSIGRKFSYCLVPYGLNASSALNFGARADVTEPGAATTRLVRSEIDTYYTVKLESIKIGNSSFKPHGSSRIIVDSGTTLTYLDKEVLDTLVKDLTKRIKLPKAESPEKLLQLCFDISHVREGQVEASLPDVTLQLGGGAAVTLKAENSFVVVQEGTMCLAMAAASQQNPVSILGNIAQQNMHVGYDLDKRTVTFAPADCASSYASAPAPSPSPSPQ